RCLLPDLPVQCAPLLVLNHAIHRSYRSAFSFALLPAPDLASWIDIISIPVLFFPTGILD
ncbi:MAG TPA: hypothetical protein PLZ44_00290, partial [Methanothrix sp.]|nr:hypothetical protein [Methanothrix sp.]